MKHLTTFLSTVLCVIGLNAQYGLVDPNFNYPNSPDSPPVTALRQPDGKILIGGSFERWGVTYCKGIARLNADGSHDAGFQTGVGISGGVGIVRDFALQPDGKIIVAGDFTNYDGTPIAGILRLHPDGMLDNTFSPGLGTNGQIYSVDLQSDGKIVIGGYFTQFNSLTASYIARLYPDGTRDSSFNAALNDWITELDVQADGKILIGGNFSTVNSVNRRGIARLLTDGTIDPAFDAGTGMNSGVNTFITDASGKIVVAGEFAMYNGSNCRNLIRLNQDGTRDLSLDAGSGTPIFNQTISSIQELTDGKLLLGGGFLVYNGTIVNRMIRILPDGSIDPSFPLETGLDGSINFIQYQQDGNLLIGGGFQECGGETANRLCTFTPDGVLVHRFNNGNGFSDDGMPQDIYDILELPDGKVLVSGNFTHYNTVPYNSLVLIKADGTAVPNFQPTIVTQLGNIVSVTRQPDGKLIVLGQYQPCIARLNTDGTNDLTFTAGLGFYNFPSQTEIQPDGKIVVAGDFYHYNQTDVNNLLRLNPDGTIDPTFVTGTGPNAPISAMLMLPNGQFLFSGSFTSYNGVTHYSMIRVNNDGSLDETFEIEASLGIFAASKIQMQPDGKILACGGFGLYRFEENGQLDSSFNASFDSPVTDFALQADGKIVVTTPSSYWAYNDVSRVNEDGSNDPTFLATVANNFGPNKVLLRQDNSLWIIGNFTEYQGLICGGIVQVNNCVSNGPIGINTFVMPSDADTCVGEVAITSSGCMGCNLSVDAGTTFTSNGYVVVENLCPGVHSVLATGTCGDTVSATFIIPVDSNYIFNNPFIDSLALDSLGTTIEECDINYNGIDTAYISDIFANGNTVTVTWEIVNASGVNTQISTYELNNGNGVYYLQLSIFCPQKSLGNFFTVTEAIYFENGEAWLGDNELLATPEASIFPNPTSANVTIKLQGAEAQLSITNAEGRELQSSAVVNGSQISLIAQPTGVYFFILRTTKGKLVKRIVKL